jgi:hypothetical protein
LPLLRESDKRGEEEEEEETSVFFIVAHLNIISFSFFFFGMNSQVFNR